MPTSRKKQKMVLTTNFGFHFLLLLVMLLLLEVRIHCSFIRHAPILPTFLLDSPIFVPGGAYLHPTYSARTNSVQAKCPCRLQVSGLPNHSLSFFANVMGSSR
jgi:hypothetical protein